jgi:signal transduction histidine kinase
VHDLRESTRASSDLPQALEALAGELALTSDTQFRLTIEGSPRDLHPIVREETYRIAAEALTNAFRHAAARQVETEVGYSRRGLTVRIADDGRGFDTVALREKAPRGHFGLAGMHERAQKIRSRLELSSRPGAGSAVLLHVPAAIAYRRARSARADL